MRVEDETLAAMAAGDVVRGDELDELFDLSVDMLCIAGFDGYFKRVNAALERTFAYSRERLMTMSFLDMCHPEDLDGSLEALRILAAGEDLIGYEHRIIRGDGEMRWVQWTTKTMPHRGYVFAAARDVTERRRADDALREARRLAEASRDEARRLAAEQSALRRVATLVARQSPPDEIFGAVAEEAGRLLEVEAIRVVRYEDDERVTIVAAWQELPGDIAPGTQMAIKGTNLARIVRDTLQPARIDDYPQAAPGVGSICGRGIRAAVGTPIIVEARLWGLIIAASSIPEPLPAGVENRLEAFTELVGTAISNVQAQADLAASRARLVAASDEERRRVVRDLHDGAQQRLVHILTQLKVAEETLAPTDEGAAAPVAQALEQADLAIVELRELAHGILPRVLTHGGLRAGIKALATRSAVAITTDVDVGRLPAAVEATAYFVVAEALTNVAKHARAESATVRIHVADGMLTVRVEDDGVGGAHPDGAGLVGLADRVASLDGRLDVGGGQRGGTTVSAVIPIPSALPVE